MKRQLPLESMLSSLADSIDWPTPSPYLSTRVKTRIETRSKSAGRPVRRRLATVLASVLVITGVLVVSPSTRQAVADLLGAAGVRIGVTADPAPTTGADLSLGDLVRLDEVGQMVGFDVRVPAGDDPGPPQGIYLSEDRQITMVWAAGLALPSARDSNIGLLLSQRPAANLEFFAQKRVGAENEVQGITVEDQPALWIEGAPHILTLFDNAGNPLEETTRLAANVLLWEANGVNHRLETTGDLESALAIVDTLEALP